MAATRTVFKISLNSPRSETFFANLKDEASIFEKLSARIATILVTVMTEMSDCPLLFSIKALSVQNSDRYRKFKHPNYHKTGVCTHQFYGNIGVYVHQNI